MRRTVVSSFCRETLNAANAADDAYIARLVRDYQDGRKLIRGARNDDEVRRMGQMVHECGMQMIRALAELPNQRTVH
ncbi:MAG: hypothetical protein RLZZ283_320 [Candidatus Parcubacteria bacterium]|jgi:hypothetical protein